MGTPGGTAGHIGHAGDADRPEGRADDLEPAATNGDTSPDARDDTPAAEGHPAANGRETANGHEAVNGHDAGVPPSDGATSSGARRPRATPRTQTPRRATARVSADDGDGDELDALFDVVKQEDSGFAEFARTRDPALRDQLVTEHLGLAHQLARRFAKRGEPYDDLVQVASVAVIKSVDRFDPGRGVEFSTFATRTVIGELKRHFRDKGWAVRAPRRIQELYLELGHAISTLSQELGRPPTVAELASTTGASEEAVLEALEAGQGYRTSSIDIPDRQEEPMANRLGDEDSRFASVDDRSVLAPALARLAPRERLILHLRFVEGLTQSEIAKHIGVSQMHVSRLLTASLARLREAFTESGD